MKHSLLFVGFGAIDLAALQLAIINARHIPAFVAEPYPEPIRPETFVIEQKFIPIPFDPPIAPRNPRLKGHERHQIRPFYMDAPRKRRNR